MPYFAHSTASDIVIECTAAFAIADGTTYADPVHTQVASVDSTLPGSPSRIHRLPAARVVWNDPVMTVPVTASKARGLSPWVWAMKFAAALFTTPVSGPCSHQIASIASSTWSNRRTSTVRTCTLPGRAADASSAASCSTAARRPHMYTSAPWPTRWLATPRPRPEPPPVIRMRLPLSSPLENACMSAPVAGGEARAGPGPLERRHELADGPRAERVAALRAVDGDPGEAALGLTGHVSEHMHWHSPFRIS